MSGGEMIMRRVVTIIPALPGWNVRVFPEKGRPWKAPIIGWALVELTNPASGNVCQIVEGVYGTENEILFTSDVDAVIEYLSPEDL